MLSKRDKPVLKNFYKIIEKRYPSGKSKLTYPYEEQLNIKLPFRAMIIAASNSGKTNFNINLIPMFCFDQIYLYAKKLTEPLYKALIDTLEEEGEQMGTELIFYDDRLIDENKRSTIPNIKNFDEELNNLVIIDDFTSINNAEAKAIEDIFTYGRKNNVSCVYSIHNFFLPRLQTVKNNVQYYIFKGVNRPDVLKRILATFVSETSLSMLLALYHVATYRKTEEEKLLAFFLIDTVTNDPKLKYRNGFYPFTPEELRQAELLSVNFER